MEVFSHCVGDRSVNDVAPQVQLKDGVDVLRLPLAVKVGDARHVAECVRHAVAV
jgi:hypothetical protein